MANNTIRGLRRNWFLLVAFPFCWVGPLPSQAQTQPVVAGNTAFALNLYSQFAPTSGNLFFSPYSISTAFAMLYAGAAGNTEAQMSQVFGFSTNQQEFASNYLALQTELESDQQPYEIQLDVANALWTQEGFPFLPAFLQTVTSAFQANVNQADFANDPAQATQDINNWVAQQTQDKIQNILPPGVINSRTRLVLANAIYFLGAWSQPFSVSNTVLQPFYPSANTAVQVPMMFQQELSSSLLYGAGATFQALELPYDTNQAFMLLLLPSQVDGLPRLEAQLSPAFLSNVLFNMHYSDVFLYLPRFSLSSSFSLSAPLAFMGMPDAFDGGADFSGIDGSEDLQVSAALHQAWIQVNESGTQAAGSTVGVIGIGAMPSPPAEFICNHPFLFLILDRETGSILFMGRVTNPASSANLAPISPLSMVPSGNGLQLSWPVALTNWSLIQNSDLTTASWKPVIGISTDGTNNFIAVSPTNTSLYYRLAPPSLPN